MFDETNMQENEILTTTLKREIRLAEKHHAQQQRNPNKKDATKAKSEHTARGIQIGTENEGPFVKTLEPITRFFEDLKSHNLLDGSSIQTDPENMAAIIDTGLLWGNEHYIAYVTDKGRNADFETFNRERGMLRKKHEPYRRFICNTKMSYRSPDDNTAPEKLSPTEIEKSQEFFVIKGPFFDRGSKKMYLDSIQRCNESCLQQGLEIIRHDPDSLSKETKEAVEKECRKRPNLYLTGDYNIGFGIKIKIGETKQKDAETFINAVISYLYNRQMGQPDGPDSRLNTLRQLLQKHFNFDLQQIQNNAEIIALSKDLIGNQITDIQPNAENAAGLDLSVLEKDKDRVGNDIQNAIQSSDSLAIYRVGEDVITAVSIITSDLTNNLLPVATENELRLLHQIKGDIDRLFEEHSTKDGKNLIQAFIGKISRLLEWIKQEEPIDPQAKIINKFASVTNTLRKKGNIIEHRVNAIQAKTDVLEKLLSLLDIYNLAIKNALKEMSSLPPEKKRDLERLKDTFSLNARVTLITKLSTERAIISEKQAFEALQIIAHNIPLLASNVIQAAEFLRRRQANHMLSGAEKATRILMEGAYKNGETAPKPVQMFHEAKQELLQITHQAEDAINLLETSQESIKSAAQEAKAELAL